MRDATRVTVETDGDEQTTRIHDDEGEVDVDGATFRFSVRTPGDSETAATEREDDDPRRIAPLDDVPTDGTMRCEAIDGRRGAEFILQRDGDDAFAWRNSCPHEPDVRLDPGGGAIVTDDQIVCHEHGARFERGDGRCTYGPCQGATLEEIDVSVRDGDVYLTDDQFEASRRLDA